MKKFVSVIAAALILALSCMPAFAAKEGGITATNLVDAKNSGFEDASSITDTGWFRLVSQGGGSTAGIELKTDGGHTGKNYIQAKIEQSWYSPAINIYPFLKAAGEGTYRIAVYMRSSDSSFSGKSAFVVRGKEADISESEVFPYIADKRDKNYYGISKGTSGEADENKWILFVSEPFDVEAESLEGDHTWWFCVDTLKKDTTLDFDDFGIYRDDEFEDPNEEPAEEMVKTDISYLTEDTISGAFPAAEKADIVTPAPDGNGTTAPNGGTDVTPAPTTEKGNSYLLVYILVPVCVLVAAGAAGFIIVKKKK